ncbi:MAG: penicillin-binding protein activator [Alphaproteobacteria bacterium]|nr:penicillin-binding protein activator [Alphaproteobacteria bacterium]
MNGFPLMARISRVLLVTAFTALAACQSTVPSGQAPVQGSGSQGAGSSQVVPPPPPGGTPPVQAPAEGTRPVLEGPGKIGALLPLSGAQAALGQALLDSIQLALNDSRGGIPVELVARDTGGTAEGARRAAESAIQAGANVIVGPLFGAEVPAVADVARARNVPVLSFTNNAAVASPGVYALGLLPRNQVERLVSYAREKGAKRFVLVAPGNPYGEIVEESVRTVVTATGGELVATERYAENMNGVSAAVKRAASARGGMDAFILAGVGDPLLMASTFVPYYDIDTKATQLLVVTVGWDDARLQQEAALFGGFIAAPLTTKRDQFLQRFKQTYNRDAPLLASLGYDAAALAVAVIREATSTDLTTGLTNASGFEGYDGVFRLRTDGTNQRLLPVLQFQRGGAKPVAEPPNRFVDLTQ